MNEKNVNLVKTFLNINEKLLTDVDLILLVWNTSAKLTDCTLNPLQELDIFYSFMTQIFDYLDINASLFSKKTEYDLLKQRIICTNFLLSSEFAESDSVMTSTLFHLGLSKRDTNQPYSLQEWPIEWQNAWRDTFKNVKLFTASQLEKIKKNVLENGFEEHAGEHYALAAKLCSISHLYLIEKSAQAFQVFCEAEHFVAKDTLGLQHVLSQSNALDRNESLGSFFDKNYSTYCQTLLSDTSQDSFNNLEMFLDIKSRNKRPKYTPRKGLCYPDVDFIRAQNLEVFKLPIVSD